MATVKTGYAPNASITFTLNSLASSTAGVGRASTKVDNTSALYVDALVSLIITLAAGAPANDQAIYVYAYGSTDLSNYTEGVTGSDAGFTINVPTELPLLGVIPTPTNAGTYKAGPYSVATAFGGTLPAYWGLVVVNVTGNAFAASGCSANYTGIQPTVV